MFHEASISGQFQCATTSVFPKITDTQEINTEHKIMEDECVVLVHCLLFTVSIYVGVTRFYFVWITQIDVYGDVRLHISTKIFSLAFLKWGFQKFSHSFYTCTVHLAIIKVLYYERMQKWVFFFKKKEVLKFTLK